MTLAENGWLVPEMALDLRPVPEEMHLRQLLDVDARSPESIATLVREVGSLLDANRPWVGVTEKLTRSRTAMSIHQARADNVARLLGLPEADWAVRPHRATHVSEEAERLMRARRLVDHVSHALAQEPTSPGWQRAGYFDELDAPFLTVPLAPDDRELGDESPETLAWFFFAGLINMGLAGISPRVLPPHLDAWPDDGDVVTGYTAACVLIFNDLVDEIPYRRCADETCGRVFRHQVGRSAGGFKRSEGVAYCSPQHARNQSQRERRRRQRADRQKGSD